MKTLDEVIQEFERQEAFIVYYMQDKTQLRSDALHYLKKLKRIEAKIEKIAIGNVEDTLSKIDNPPLSWEQLKQMEGKPVFVEVNDGEFKKWFIVGHFFSWFEKEDFDAHVNLYKCGGAMEFCKESYGDWWRAYRKEK